MKTDPLPTLCETIALELVARASVTGSADEQTFGPWLADYLSRLGCFGQNPEIWTFPVASGDARLVVALLVRGSGAQTVVLTGHYDTVSIHDYGHLRALACQPYALKDALLQRLSGSTEPAEMLAYADLQSGAFLPGRGLLDMKAGLAAGLDAMAQIAAGQNFSGNLLFLAVPDEENASAGARAAAACLAKLAESKGLSILAAINLDAISDLGDGAAGRVLALGTVGKVLPTAFVVGRPVHSGYALLGVNAAILAATIAERLEWAPELTDDSAELPGTAASLLSLKDGKSGYDVTTPASAFLFWNVLNHRRSAAAALDIVARLVDEATRDCLARLAERAAMSGNAADAAMLGRQVHPALQRTFGRGACQKPRCGRDTGRRDCPKCGVGSAGSLPCGDGGAVGFVRPQRASRCVGSRINPLPCHRNQRRSYFQRDRFFSGAGCRQAWHNFAGRCVFCRHFGYELFRAG